MIYITGKGGQLATALENLFQLHLVEFKSFSREEWDICDESACEFYLKDSCNILINAAAYTRVDLAEKEEKKAYDINTLGVKNLSIHCELRKVLLIHVSTDFIFHSIPKNENGELCFWNPSSKPSPHGIYSLSKFKGEEEILNRLKSNFYIIRTSWLYGDYGSNFVRTILSLLLQKDRKSLHIIEDQIGRPTYVNSLSEFIYLIIRKHFSLESIPNILHFSNLGVASWYDFAIEIQRLGIKKGILSNKIPIHPIPTENYPTPAKRPKFSVLNLEKTLSLMPNVPHWKEDLEKCITNIHRNTTKIL